MQKFSEVLQFIDSLLGSSQWFALLLLGTVLFFAIYSGFLQFQYFSYVLKIVTGKFDRDTDMGDASHLQTLVTVSSETVGTGTIAFIKIHNLFGLRSLWEEIKT